MRQFLPVALVIAVVLPALAAALGAVSLIRICGRRRKLKGMGSAVTATVGGAVLTVLGLVALVAIPC